MFALAKQVRQYPDFCLLDLFWWRGHAFCVKLRHCLSFESSTYFAIFLTSNKLFYNPALVTLCGRPLMGPNAYYVNLFTHYRPIGDPAWFNKPNHEGVPDPVVEVEGECKLEKVATAETYNKQLGVVESVKCSDPRLGHFISPTLFKAENGGDLIKWWEMTSPPKPESSTSGSSGGRDEL
jgi:hypothetical protein